jgi:hypothetical protein
MYWAPPASPGYDSELPSARRGRKRGRKRPGTAAAAALQVPQRSFVLQRAFDAACARLPYGVSQWCGANPGTAAAAALQRGSQSSPQLGRRVRRLSLSRRPSAWIHWL